MIEPRKENCNEKAEDSGEKGFFSNILAFGNRHFHVHKIIQIVYPEGGNAEDSQPKLTTAILTDAIQMWKMKIQIPSDLCGIFKGKLPIKKNNEKAEVIEEKGILTDILTFWHWPNHIRNTIQALHPFDALGTWMNGVLLWIPRGDLQEKIEELQKMIDQLQTELEWRKARNNTDDITFDTNTAHPNLYIDTDTNSLSYKAQPQQVPSDPERFDSAVCVLGAEGFSSGKHYWEVDVGCISDWDLGIAGKSTQRKGRFSLSPKEGFWVLGFSGRDYWAKTDPWTRVMVQKKPTKIGVCLSYDDRQVSFFSVNDMSVLLTFNDCAFSEEVYPFFKISHKETTIRIASIKEEE
ncbi:butyrophilin subfamily 3 member A1-like isoform X2 [Pelodiscus sinensis]|uniref:butyrophilin subfamily 3 member A1-like isoform X2 n=1 Tax=Pelodiscus sinensis TaxID=13735 RepID=UPI003F6C787B